MTLALVTGGTGFVGANLVRRLLRDGHEVHLLVRPGFSPWRVEEVRADVRLHVAPLADAAAVERAVRAARPEWVFHLAAHGAYSWQTGVAEIVATNYLGTVALVEACLKCGVGAVVNAGSSSEYGWKDHPPPEDELPDPNSRYAATKTAATLYCRFAARQHAVRIPTLRLYSAYGPYEEPARLMPTLVLHALRGELPPLVRPDIARDYVAVEDVVDAFLLAATAPLADPGAVYNVGTGVQTDLRQLVAMAREVLGVTAEPRWGSMPDRHWETTVWVADATRVRAELGWQPRVALADGVRRLADWFRAHPAWRERYETKRAAA